MDPAQSPNEGRWGGRKTLIALVGTPNCGKTTIFNRLTGLHQKVGNFPGVTVEPAVGTFDDEQTHLTLIDLPGTYSLVPKSQDEKVTTSILKGEQDQVAQPNAVVAFVDGTNLEKSLFLLTYIVELRIPTLVVVTMIDAIKGQGGTLDDIGFEHLLGAAVIPVVGNKGLGMEDLKSSLLTPETFLIPNLLCEPDADIADRYSKARELASTIVNISYRDTLSERLDGVLLHPVCGPAIFVVLMLAFFQAIFSLAEPAMAGIEAVVAFLNDWVTTIIPQGFAQSLLTKGIVAGVGAVIVFLPQIIILNTLIVLLEDCGYLARAAFLVDRIMGLFGLQGRSFIPLLGSYACAIPGIMSARIIPSDKDRMVTMLVAPIMTCSARLPVYALLIGAFIPSVMIGGIISLPALVLAFLYLLAGISGLVVALVFKSTVFRGSTVPFLMEFPPYRVPSLRSLLVTVWIRSKDFLQTAGTVILGISMLLWVLTEFPKTDVPAGTPDLVAQSMQLEASYAGQIGHAIQPLFAPLGFDWKLTVGVIGSFAAREVFVSVMGQLYSADVSGSDAGLRTVLQQNIEVPVALGVLAFYVYALQCMSTIAVLYRETRSWKWPIVAFGYMFALAYGFAFATRYIAQLVM